MRTNSDLEKTNMPVFVVPFQCSCLDIVGIYIYIYVNIYDHICMSLISLCIVCICILI